MSSNSPSLANIETLVVSFYAGIDRFQMSEVSVFLPISNTSKAAILRCDSKFSVLCPYIRMHGSNSLNSLENLWICKTCITKRKTWTAHFKLLEIFFDDYFSSKNQESANCFVDSINCTNGELDTRAIWFEDVPVGAFATYDLMVNNRINHYPISQRYFLEFKEICRQVITVSLAFRQLLKSLKSLKRLIISDPLYSLHRPIIHIAQALELEVVQLACTPSGSLSDLGISLEPLDRDLRNPSVSDAWSMFREIPFGSNLDVLKEYFSRKFKGADIFAYSPALKKYRKSPDINNTHINEEISMDYVLIPLSSGDEQIASHISRNPSCSEEDFFQYTLNGQIEFCKQIRDLVPCEKQLVVRPHPRLLDSRRFNTPHFNARDLIRLFSVLPNTVVDFGSNQSSVYESIIQAKLIITQNSTVGVESMILGTPSIKTDNYPFSYPSSLSYRMDDLEFLLQTKKPELHLSNAFLTKQRDAMAWLVFQQDFIFHFPKSKTQKSLGNSNEIDSMKSRILNSKMMNFGVSLASRLASFEFIREGVAPLRTRRYVQNSLAKRIPNYPSLTYAASQLLSIGKMPSSVLMNVNEYILSRQTQDNFGMSNAEFQALFIEDFITWIEQEIEITLLPDRK